MQWFDQCCRNGVADTEVQVFLHLSNQYLDALDGIDASDMDRSPRPSILELRQVRRERAVFSVHNADLFPGEIKQRTSAIAVIDRRIYSKVSWCDARNMSSEQHLLSNSHWETHDKHAIASRTGVAVRELHWSTYRLGEFQQRDIELRILKNDTP